MKENKIYYVYAWYRKTTNHIFHIGKGKNDRMYQTTQHCNEYFKNMLNKYDDCDVKIIEDNLTEEEAWNLERELIKKYQSVGQCETNLHEGGCGGNTGNYKVVGEKVRQFRKTHSLTEKQKKVLKDMNDKVRGKKQTKEHKLKESESAKKSWADRQSESNIKRLNNLQKYLFKPGEKPWNTGKQLPEEMIHKMIINNRNTCLYQVYFNDILVYWCYGHTLLYKYCKEKFNISPTIIVQIINGTWKCKFKKYAHLKNSLKILKLDKSVSTIGDECNQVEWRLQPFEVQGNQ